MVKKICHEPAAMTHVRPHYFFLQVTVMCGIIVMTSYQLFISPPATIILTLADQTARDRV